ncbi:hypothetical protein [Bacterioplanoides sp.]|uniref:hypothetical protein n=1 Tax=Bacterioplanoides sp. TaxID=2066072 RepID=UPI003B59EE8F
MSETTNNCNWYDPSCSLEWIRDELQAFGVWVLDSTLSAAAGIFESIPAPEFLTSAEAYSIPPSVSWAASAFQLDIGAGIIVSAYIARFILRRIPIIG